MAPTISFSLVARAGSSAGDEDTSIKPSVIGGIVIAGLAGLGLVIWATIHFIRKRASANRAAKRTSAFLTIKGIVKDGEEEKDDGNPMATHALSVKGQFSRNQLNNPSVILPAKLRPDASREEIIQAYTEEGTLPRPFAPFMAGGGGSRDSQDNTADRDSAEPPSLTHPTARPNPPFLAAARNSIMSIGSSHRFSVISVASTTASSVGSRAFVGKRKVRQLFTPVLPDELVVSLNEEVNVINSFDDGWCIVGKSGLGGEVDMGAIPAWCFVKPQPGLQARRPVRVSSLGVTIQIDAPGPGSRQEVMSWSNF